MVTRILDVVEHEGCFGVAVSLETCCDDLSECFLVAEEVYFKCIRIFLSVYETEILRESLVEDESSYCGLYQLTFVSFERITSDLDFGVDADNSGIVCHDHFVIVCEAFAVALLCVAVSLFAAFVCQVV